MQVKFENGTILCQYGKPERRKEGAALITLNPNVDSVTVALYQEVKQWLRGQGLKHSVLNRPTMNLWAWEVKV